MSSFGLSYEDHAIYRWYEESEDPLWEQIMSEYGLPWWLREHETHPEPHWFVEAYPKLAPYFPYIPQSSQNIDPTLPYMGYWWP